MERLLAFNKKHGKTAPSEQSDLFVSSVAVIGGYKNGRAKQLKCMVSR